MIDPLIAFILATVLGVLVNSFIIWRVLLAFHSLQADVSRLWNKLYEPPTIQPTMSVHDRVWVLPPARELKELEG